MKSYHEKEAFKNCELFGESILKYLFEGRTRIYLFDFQKILTAIVLTSSASALAFSLSVAVSTAVSPCSVASSILAAILAYSGPVLTAVLASSADVLAFSTDALISSI